VRSTFRDIAAHRGRFGSIDLRTAIVRHVQPIAALEVEHAIRTRTPTAVFRAVERWRSLSTQVADVAPERDDEAAELLADLRAISRARAEIADDRSADPAAARRDAELAIRQASGERELRAREWYRHGEGGTVEVAGPAAVEEGLCRAGTAR